MSLKEQAISGTKWNGISMSLITIIQFGTLTILARILSPSDFGIMGMIMVIIVFAQAFADMGMSNAIIQRQNVKESHLSSLYWINVFCGLLIFICILLIRKIIVSFFNEPKLINYLMYVGFIFLITPFGQIFRSLLIKELNFKDLFKVNIIAMFAYSITSIGFAIAKFGVLSLIFGQLIRSLMTVIILFYFFRKLWLPKLHLNIREVKSYISFGAFQMGERIVNYFSSNIDYIIIGCFLGSTPLGFYTLAYQIVIFPLSKINPIITEVAFSAFSKVQNNNFEIRKGYCEVIHFISMLSFPLLFGMLAIAPEFIKLVYGKKWEPTIAVLQILCIVGIFKSLGNSIGSILLAKGRPDIGFYWNVFAVIVVSIAVIVGVNWGITGVASAILILQVPFFFIIQPIVNRLIELKLSDYFKTIQWPFLCSFIMLIGIISFKLIFGYFHMLPLLLITISFGGAIYITSYYIKDRETLFKFRTMLRGI